MRNRIGKRWYLIAAALFLAGLLLTPCAVAQDVNMQLIGAGPLTPVAGVYVGPYTAVINGVTTQVICDDFADDTYIGESWQAVQSSFSSLTDPKFGAANLLLYEQGAWLVLQMLKPANASSIGAIQYAFWELFDPSAPFIRLTSYEISTATAQSWLTLAQAQGPATFTPGEFSSFVVYTPVPGTAESCPDGPCPITSPQEFLALKTPEPAALLVLLLDLLALAGVILFVRRHVAEAAG